MSGGPLIQLLTTLPDRASALELARAAVGGRLAACAQVAGPITSVYRWEGAMHEDQEFLLILKAPNESAAPLMAFVRERHPYDTPELTAVESDLVDERYLAWVVAEVSPPE